MSSPSGAAQPPVTLYALRKVFNAFDANGSGTDDVTEMKQMIKKLNISLTPVEVGVLMKEADPDGSGEIDFEEFSTILRKQLKDGKGGGLAKVATRRAAPSVGSTRFRGSARRTSRHPRRRRGP